LDEKKIASTHAGFGLVVVVGPLARIGQIEMDRDGHRTGPRVAAEQIDAGHGVTKDALAPVLERGANAEFRRADRLNALRLARRAAVLGDAP
jgi:hypothetical protein